MDIEIGGYRFYTEDLESEVSDNHKEVLRTPLMNGGEFVSYGRNLPMIWKFKTHIKSNNLLKTRNMINKLQNSINKVYCKQIGKGFYATCEIKRNIEPDIRNTILLEFTLTEVFMKKHARIKVSNLSWKGNW